MVHSFWMLQRVNPGFNPDKLLTFSLNLPKTTYSTAQSCQDFWARLGDRIRQIPGVTSATLMSGLPPVRHADDDDTDIENFVRVPGGPIENVTYYQIVDEQFFHTLGARIVQGRALERRDFSKLTPGVVVNQAMALTFWPHQSPIGRRVRPGVPGAPWLTVVGVVADLKNAGLSKATETELFVPYRFAPFPELISQVYVAVKSTSDPMALLPQLHDVLGSLDPSLPIAEVRTMDEVIAAASSRPRFLTVILSLFSAVAIGLAALGIYGVISYSVAQRHVEFGIRLALGARPASMLWGVIVRGLLLGAAGVCCGAIAALLLMRSLQGLLFGVSYLDLSSFTGTAVLIIGVVTAACAIPAYRAMRIQPVQALRYE
jgi:putative ABC transport system permease protein